MNKKLLFVILLNFGFSQIEQPYPPLNLVTIPTAGTMPKGYYSFENVFMNKGSIVPKFTIGITDNFTLGVSFGISNFIGNGKIEKYKSYPEVQIKYRIFDETENNPALVLGLDTQGRGEFYENYLSLPLNRYEQKSFGLYLVMSRNWNVLGNFGFHFGINKNLTESEDKDDDINLFLGFDKELNKSFSLYCEYNFSRDDDRYNDDIDEIILRKGNGYLNGGLRWSATASLMLEINVSDMRKNNKNSDALNRELKIIYFEKF